MNALKTAIVLFIFGVLVLGGGTAGYLKANSLISLGSGCVIGILAFIFSYGISQNYPKALYSALILVFATGVFFAYRWYTTGSFMPGGLMCIVSLITFAILLCRKCECNKEMHSSKL